VGEGVERGGLVESTTAGGVLSLGRARRLATPFWRHRWLRTAAELLPPVGWMTLIYVAALAALFVSAFWSVDSFTGKVVHTWSLDNFREIFQSPR
jgi:putative spermidine/putrescine transport system permease protein